LRPKLVGRKKHWKEGPIEQNNGEQLEESFIWLANNLLSRRVVPHLQWRRAIPKATPFFLHRSAGLLSSACPSGGGAERGARLLGGRTLYMRSLRFVSYRSSTVTFISLPRVSSLFQITGDGGGSDGLGWRLVVLLLVFGMELLGAPMIGWLGYVGISVVYGMDAVKLFCFGGSAGIPDGGGGGSLFRSLAGWPAVVDLFSSLTSHKWSADVLSMLMMCFGVATSMFDDTCERWRWSSDGGWMLPPRRRRAVWWRHFFSLAPGPCVVFFTIRRTLLQSGM
jgi:hypothetical protein